jgi:hypothetical protein
MHVFNGIFLEYVGFCFVVDGYWKDWSKWDICNVTCGGGLQWRSRDCVQPFYGGLECNGTGSESKDCNTEYCPSRYFS